VQPPGNGHRLNKPGNLKKGGSGVSVEDTKGLAIEYFQGGEGIRRRADALLAEA